MSLRTIVNFEAGNHKTISANLHMIQRALETEGIIFIDSNGGGPGVRLKKKRGA